MSYFSLDTVTNPCLSSLYLEVMKVQLEQGFKVFAKWPEVIMSVEC